jgi:ABC-type oligopeptide transport system substrate-binding subunit
LGCPEEVIQIEQVPFGQLVADTRPNSPNRPDIWDLGWVAHYPDAHGWFGDVLHCQSSENRPNRPCSEVDTQIVDAATTVPLDERWQAYRTIENLFFAQDGLEPITPLFVRAEYHMVQRWMDAYYPAYVGGDQYDRFVVNAGNKELERLD